MTHCPICGKEIEYYHEVSSNEPYTYTNPYDGIMIYGAFSSPKETLCSENSFLHFAFYDPNDNLVAHTLVQLGVAEPRTISPSAEYLVGMNEHNDEEYEDPELEEPDYTAEDLYDINEDEYPF